MFNPPRCFEPVHEDAHPLPGDAKLLRYGGLREFELGVHQIATPLVVETTHEVAEEIAGLVALETRRPLRGEKERGAEDTIERGR